MAKPKIAFFDFTSCEGCQIELTNMGAEAFLGLLEHVEIVEFREAMTETFDETIDISFIEGSFSRESDRARLEKIRSRSNLVIAFGACAVTGGVNALKNHQEDYKEYVYEHLAKQKHLSTNIAKPISAAIKVDYSIRGCPISRMEFLQIVSHLLHQKAPVIPDYPVCVECKRREIVCQFEIGNYCMGSLAVAGCNAPCPAAGIPCEACRGFVEKANQKALSKVLMERCNFSPERAENYTRMFTANLRSDTNEAKES